MIGDLAASICFDDGDIGRVEQQVLGLARYALREHGRVLDDPEFIFGFFAAGVGEGAHIGPRGFIVDPTQRPDFHSDCAN